MTQTEPTKLAFLVIHTGLGGAENVVRKLMEQLPRDQFDMTLFAPAEQPLTEIADELGIRVQQIKQPEYPSTSVELSSGRRIFNPFATLGTAALSFGQSIQLGRLLNQHNIEVVYTGSMIAHAIGSLSAQFFPFKVVCHVQDIVRPDMLRGYGPKMLSWYLQTLSDHVVVPSQAVADSLEMSDDKITVVYNAVDMSRFDVDHQSTLREDYDLPGDKILIGAIGRLTRWKGQHVLLEAAAQVKNDSSHFVIVGDAAFGIREYRDELEAKVAEHDLTNRVTFTGFRKDVPNVMAGLDIIVVPSTRPDPCPLVVIESMASGKTVVGSNLGGIPELIADQESGVIFHAEDAAALATVLDDLVADEQKRHTYDKRARERAEALFSIERFADEMTSVLKSVL